MCLTLSEIIFCGGACKISNVGLPVAIQTNGCLHFALGGSDPVCDGVLNGINRLTSTLSFPEVWCEEHERLRRRSRGDSDKLTRALGLIYRSVEEWIEIGKFKNARGFEVLRCSLLYQADLNTYVRNSQKALMARLATQKETPRLPKRKLEDVQTITSDQMVRDEKRVKLAAKSVAEQRRGSPQKRTEPLPNPSVAASVAKMSSIVNEEIPSTVNDEILTTASNKIPPVEKDEISTITNNEIAPLPKDFGIPESNEGVPDFLDWSGDVLNARDLLNWNGNAVNAPNPLDSIDDKVLQELFGFGDGELYVPELFSC